MACKSPVCEFIHFLTTRFEVWSLPSFTRQSLKMTGSNPVTTADLKLTFTFESLSYQTPQHLATVVTEGWRSVRVDKQTVRTDLKVLHCSWSWRDQAKENESWRIPNDSTFKTPKPPGDATVCLFFWWPNEFERLHPVWRSVAAAYADNPCRRKPSSVRWRWSGAEVLARLNEF